MSADILRNAQAVLLPAFAPLHLDDNVIRHLDSGGVAILLGETREEYLSRAMSADRVLSETEDKFMSVTQLARDAAGTDVIIAVDQELGGIQRLHILTPSLPSLEVATTMSDAELEKACRNTAQAARTLGVNLFLSPIVDVVAAPHPWLEGRTLGPNATTVGRLAASFVRGVQSSGVTATAKHFPGYPFLSADPAVTEARLTGNRELLDVGLSAFRSVLRAGVRAVMLGPAVVEALDPIRSASISPSVVALLRSELGFRGLIITDDLDSPATLLNFTLEEVAVMALQAGAELLLLAADNRLPSIVAAIASAVESGELREDMLALAADKVRVVAGQASQ